MIASPESLLDEYDRLRDECSRANRAARDACATARELTQKAHDLAAKHKAVREEIRALLRGDVPRSMVVVDENKTAMAEYMAELAAAGTTVTDK